MFSAAMSSRKITTIAAPSERSEAASARARGADGADEPGLCPATVRGDRLGFVDQKGSSFVIAMAALPRKKR
jgi:hypothetical protein